MCLVNSSRARSHDNEVRLGSPLPSIKGEGEVRVCEWNVDSENRLQFVPPAAAHLSPLPACGERRTRTHPSTMLDAYTGEKRNQNSSKLEVH